MKNFIPYLYATLILMFIVFPLCIYAAPGAVQSPKIPVHLVAYVLPFVILVIATIVFTIIINRLIVVSGFSKQFLSWVIALFFTFLAWLFKLQMFENTHWIMFVVWGIDVAFVSNGVYKAFSKIPFKISINKAA